MDAILAGHAVVNNPSSASLDLHAAARALADANAKKEKEDPTLRQDLGDIKGMFSGGMGTVRQFGIAALASARSPSVGYNRFRLDDLQARNLRRGWQNNTFNAESRRLMAEEFLGPNADTSNLPLTRNAFLQELKLRPLRLPIEETMQRAARGIAGGLTSAYGRARGIAGAANYLYQQGGARTVAGVAAGLPWQALKSVPGALRSMAGGLGSMAGGVGAFMAANPLTIGLIGGVVASHFATEYIQAGTDDELQHLEEISRLTGERGQMMAEAAGSSRGWMPTQLRQQMAENQKELNLYLGGSQPTWRWLQRDRNAAALSTAKSERMGMEMHRKFGTQKVGDNVFSGQVDLQFGVNGWAEKSGRLIDAPGYMLDYLLGRSPDQRATATAQAKLEYYQQVEAATTQFRKINSANPMRRANNYIAMSQLRAVEQNRWDSSLQWAMV